MLPLKILKTFFWQKRKNTEDVSESGKVQRHSSDFSIIGPERERDTKKEILTIDFQSRFFSSLVGGFETETKNFGFGSKKNRKSSRARNASRPSRASISSFFKVLFFGQEKKDLKASSIWLDREKGRENERTNDRAYLTLSYSPSGFCKGSTFLYLTRLSFLLIPPPQKSGTTPSHTHSLFPCEA